jgi:Skp family chaperone for outer membrane proteins
MKFKYLGWIVAAALVVVAVTAGFQGGAPKIGIVDANKVLAESEYAKAENEVIKAMVIARQEMLQFVDSYRTFTPEQATPFHDISLKPNPTPAEKAQLDKIKTDVQTASKRLNELRQKANPTADELKELNELSRREQTTTETAQKWNRDAETELETKHNDSQKIGLDKVREAIKQVGAAQSYTLVFIADVAPYGANDLTPDVLKVMNKK